MQINEDIKKIAEQIMEAVDAEKIYLFGSYAYGIPNNDSDYDFYVVIPDDSLRPLDAMKKIYGALAKTKMKTPIDVLALGLSNFEKRSTMMTLEGRVAREGALIYNEIEPPRTHNLIMLCQMCMEINGSFEEVLDDCTELTSYGVVTRYPNEVEITEAESKIAIRK